jgi:signal peptidase I
MNIRRIFSAFVAASATAAVLGSLVVAGATAQAARSETMHLHIVGGSMEPTIHIGDIITVDPTLSPNMGDIISFEVEDHTVTHRVTKRWLSTDPHGVVHTMFKAKGDANATEDAWTLTDGQIYGTLVSTPAIIIAAEPFANHPLLIAMLLLPLLASILMAEFRNIRNEVHALRVHKNAECPERESNPQEVTFRGV